MKKNSKCRRNGKLIKCPKCGKTQKVYHLAWSALNCQSCSWMVEKMDWLIERGTHEK